KQRKPGQAQREQAGDALDDVLVLEVAQFVREHRVDLARGQFGQERVVEHYALGGAKAGEIGVGVGAALAAVHHEQALGREAAAAHQLGDAGLERFVLKRLELVEQRRDEHRIDHQQQQVES